MPHADAICLNAEGTTRHCRICSRSRERHCKATWLQKVFLQNFCARHEQTAPPLVDKPCGGRPDHVPNQEDHTMKNKIHAASDNVNPNPNSDMNPSLDSDTEGFQTGIKDAARREVEELRQRAGDLAEKAREEGGKLGKTAVRLIVDELDQRKARLTQGLVEITDTVRNAAQSRPEPSPLMSQAVQMLDNVSGTIEGYSVQDVGSMLTDFGRRNPATFVATCLLTGIALGRFLAASDDTPQAQREDDFSAGRGNVLMPSFDDSFQQRREDTYGSL